MAAKNTTTKPDETTETAPTAPETTGEVKKTITRPQVKMVLTSVAEIAAEVSEDPDDFTGKRAKKTIDDELQKAFHGYVTKSWENQKHITLVVSPEAERETVKRLRLAAETLGHGMSIGNVRPDKTDPSKVRVPFLTTKRRQYKKNTTDTTGESESGK